MYNIHVDHWVSAEFLIEFPPSGGRLMVHPRIRLFKPNTIETNMEFGLLIADQVRLVIVLYIVLVSQRLGIAHKITYRRPGFLYYVSLGGIADTCVVIAYVISTWTQYSFFRSDSTVKALEYISHDERFPGADYDYRGFIDWGRQATEYEMLAIYDGAILFWVCVRLLTYLRLSYRIFLLWRTVGVAGARYFYVLLMFIPSFCAWILWAHKLWGNDIEGFSTVNYSYLTLLMFINGSVQYEEMFDLQSGWTPLFMLGFFYLISFSLISACVAITVDAFYTIWLTGEVSLKGDMGGHKYRWDWNRWMRFFFPNIMTLKESLMSEIETADKG
jgi:hypothetical protein